MRNRFWRKMWRLTLYMRDGLSIFIQKEPQRTEFMGVCVFICYVFSPSFLAQITCTKMKITPTQKSTADICTTSLPLPR